jgi:all-trans-8'-apo-beta-carotenal 15,15'-oxygenase
MISMLQSERVSKVEEDALYEDVMTNWRKGYQTCEDEVCTSIADNSIPKDLIGTYYKNGHAKFMVGKDKILHPFDGDGMITALTINDGSILFRNKYVRTKGYVLERGTKRISYRNSFGTQKPGGIFANIFDLNIKNVANTNVIYHDGKLLALWEGGLPYRLEADILRTQGEYTCRGLLKRGDGFSAHPRHDATTGNLVSFAVKERGKTTKIEVYEFGDKLDVKKKISFECPGFVFFHDFVVTENYYIFDHAPLGFDATPFILGLQCPADCISYDPSKPANLYLVPRDGSPMQTITVDPHFNFHFANAFEENGTINIDVIWTDQMVLGKVTGNAEPIWEKIDYQKEVPAYNLIRYSLNKDKADGSLKYSKQKLSDARMDFVSVNPAASCKKVR